MESLRSWRSSVAPNIALNRTRRARVFFVRPPVAAGRLA
jgi:hypothetical protein